MTAAIILPLARGCSSPPVGLSARGTDYLPGAPRCALASASLCQEAADQFSHDVADRLPGLGVVPEVVVTVWEARRLHAPSIRMEIDQCLRIKPPEKCCGISA